jgi:serine/threonine protein kinase
MEYCGGGDLSHFIRSKQTLTEATAKRFLRQLGRIIPPNFSEKNCDLYQY